MPIHTQKHCRETPEPEDGTRILTMRFWPRGVRREHFDAWVRELAPSAELLRWCWAEQEKPALDKYIYEQTWRARYIGEMAAQKPLLDDLRRRHEAGETLTLLCTCHDPGRCHRTVLASLILRTDR